MEDSADRKVSQSTGVSAASTESVLSRPLRAPDVGNVHWFQVRQSDEERSNARMANWHVDHIFGFKMNHAESP